MEVCRLRAIANPTGDGPDRPNGFTFDCFDEPNYVGQDHEWIVSARDMVASLDVTEEFAQGRSGMGRTGWECPITSTID